MIILGSIAFVGALLIALGTYGYPFWFDVLGPAWAVSLSLFAQLVGMTLVIGTLLKGSILLQDRRWHAARDGIVNDVTRDLDEIMSDLGPMIRRADPGQQTIFDDYTPLLISLRRTLDTPRLGDRLQYMTAGFTPEMAAFVSQYIGLRDEMRDTLRIINTTQFLGFTDGHRLRSDGWRLTAVTEDFRSAFTDGELIVAWFLALGQMLEATLENPTAGWRSTPEFERMRAELQDMRDRCHEPYYEPQPVVEDYEPDMADPDYYYYER
ncbi:MAG: hypothetical protein AAGC70_15135 [Pseudomonadota bacterium]